ncbi:uncharacterized protein LOC132565346 [Ylistrum balloti]|uniref:uncharacterized protein LOC132565346 n=1 Tax=Ylistrum balloti TaxID=509963 RepID=UPI0029059099|nr:uncharacterized protein LOC132565346 [Ylistrum balloti]
MLQLYRNPSLWSVLALCAYALNLLFHVIAFCSDHWATCIYMGKHTWFGLWQGCWTDDITKETKCSDSIFQHPSFNSGKQTGWHKGAQVLMTISLISLLFTEVILIGYACVVKLESYKPRMIGMLIGLSISEVFITGIVIMMVGTEVMLLESGHMSWGYGIKCTCLVLTLITLSLVYKDRYHFFGSRADLVTQSEKASDKNDFDNPAFTDKNSNDFSGSLMASSTKLSSSGLGTLDRDSRSFSCSDIFTVTPGVSFLQEPSEKSRGRFGGSADNVARTSDFHNLRQSGIASSRDRPDGTFPVSLSQEPTCRISFDSLTIKTKSVNMSPDPNNIHHEATVHQQQKKGSCSRLPSSSSIESEV